MKAARIYEPGKPFQIDEVAKPEMKPGHALVKVKAAGVCGSELDFVEGIFPFTPPFTLGHEIAGVIEEIDPEYEILAQVGDRVAVYNYMGCGVCRCCRDDKENMCPNNKGQFGFTVDGGFAEYVLVPVYNLVPIPDGVEFEEAAILACSGMTAMHSARRVNAQIGEYVAVNGVGGVGLMCIQTAKIRGNKVIAIADNEMRAELAKSVGADFAIVETDYTKVPDKVRACTPGGEGIQAWFDLVGTTESYLAGIQSQRRGGKVCIIGYQPANNINFYPVDMMVKEGQIVSSVAGCKRDVELALQYCAEGRIKVVVGARFKLEDINEPINMLINRTARGRSVIIFD